MYLASKFILRTTKPHGIDSKLKSSYQLMWTRESRSRTNFAEHKFLATKDER